MSTLPGIIFKVDMSPIDNFIRREYPNIIELARDARINKLLLTHNSPKETQVNYEHELVKISTELEKIKYDFLSQYNKNNGKIKETFIEQCNNILQQRKQEILIIYDRYAKELLKAYQEELAGIENFYKKKDLLASLLSQKKKTIEQSIDADINRIARLPIAIGSSPIQQGLHFHRRLDKDKLQTFNTYQDIDDNLDAFIAYNDSNKTTVLTYDFIDSHAGKYEYNRYESRRAKLEIEFTKTKDGYNYKINLFDHQRKQKYFSSDKDLLAAYRGLISHIATHKDCDLNLGNFQERFRKQLLTDWVEKHGRSLADVIEADSLPQGTYQAIHEIVKNNITQTSLLAYCTMSHTQKVALDKQIANGGLPLNLVDVFPEISSLNEQQRMLLQQQISNKGNKPHSQTYPIPAQEVKQINELYKKYKHAIEEIVIINQLYDTHLRLKNTAVYNNAALKNGLINLTKTKLYGHYCSIAKNYFKQQKLLVTPKRKLLQIPQKQVVSPDSIYENLLPITSTAFNDKVDVIHSSNNKEKYLPQNPKEICDIFTSGLSPLSTVLDLFSKLPLNKQKNIIYNLDLGPQQQNALLLAKLFSVLPAGHHHEVYQQLTTTYQPKAGYIHPYLPHDLQIICAPKQPAQFSNNDIINVERVFSASSATAKDSYCKLMQQTLQKSDLERADTYKSITNDIVNICNTQNSSYLSIGLALSTILADQQFNASQLTKTYIKNIILDYLLYNESTVTDTAKIITQLTPAAQYQLSELIIKKIHEQRSENAPSEFTIGSLAKILNNIRSSEILRHLAANLNDQQLLTQILNHPEFKNKSGFKSFTAGIVREENPVSKQRQLKTFQQINSTDKIDAQFKKSLAFKALDTENQHEICNTTIKRIILADKYWHKKTEIEPMLKQLHQEFTKHLDNLKKLSSSAAEQSSAQQSYQAQLNCYKSLYSLAKKFKHDADGSEPKASVLANIKQQLETIKTDINTKLKTNTVTDADYEIALDKLKTLDFNSTKLAIDTLYTNLLAIKNPAYTYADELLLYYCPVMDTEIAGLLLAEAQQKAKELLISEEKLFLNLKETVKQQVFAKLSEKTQLAIIKNNETSSMKRAGYLNHLSADTLKKLIMQIQPLNLELLADLKPQLQKELITNQKLLDDHAYNQLALLHRQQGNKTLLQEFYNARPFADAIIADIGIKRAAESNPKASSKQSDPMELLMNQMKSKP